MSNRKPLTADERLEIDRVAAAADVGDHYAVLGVHLGASVVAVEDAWRSFARTWHPDRFYSRETGDLAGTIDLNFVAATTAWQVLSDPARRAAFDRELGGRGRSLTPGVHSGTASGTTSGTTSGVGAWRQGPVAWPPSDVSRPPSDASRAARPSPGTASDALRAEFLPPPRTAQPRPEPARPEPARPEPVRPAAAPVEPPRPAPEPGYRPPAAVLRAQEAIAEQLGRARAYAASGREDLEAGRYSKAESALYLAAKFDPRNAEYQQLLQQAQRKAAEIRARAHVQLAESEESFGRTKEAIAAYRKAVDCDPAEGVAFFRLSRYVLKEENDERQAVSLLRKAVAKEPKNAAYRLALAELYEKNGLGANALREAQAAFDVEPKNDAARAMVRRLRR